MAISAQDVQASYAAAGLPPPSAQDIQYWTQTYAQSPDVAFSPNPQQQVVNAILASAPDEYDQGRFNFLAGGLNPALQNVIDTAYLKTLGRPADPVGLAFYASELEAGRSVGDILADLNYAASNQATTAASNASVDPSSVQPIDLITGGGTQGVTVNPPTTTVNPPTTTVNPPTTTGFQGASRDDILGLYRSIGLPDPSDTDVAFWQNFSRTNPDVLGAANPMTQLTNAFRAASRQSLKSDPLPTTGESNIDPLISPYLSEALGVARNLFLTGEGPELYPGQMYVSPSTDTLDAIMAAENLGRSTTVSGLGEDVFGAYAGGLGTLANFASPDYMKSQDYKDYVSSITRPITEAVTEDIIPGIQSGFSMAGRYGSGAMGDITAKATGKAATAIGDVTSRIAQQERQNQFSAVTALPGFLSNLSGVTAGALAPSGILAGVGAQREGISGQPLQEAIRRFEYGENLPANQLAAYLSSIYGSPLGNITQPQEAQRNQLGQVLGGGILGSQLGSLFGGAGGFTGGQIGAGLGALGGLLL
jgi:hypothetical protein